MPSENTPLLSVRNIYKAFGSNEVLKGVNLDIHKGEVLALIGGNGAGKSTLVKSVMGIHRPDKGEILINGMEIPYGSPSASLDSGVYLVPQEPMLFPNMTLEENVLMGIKGDKQQLREKLKDFAAKLANVDLERSARTLSIAEQQLVEILRGLMREAKILFFDEPTSSLTFDEVISLFGIIKELKAKGVGIIYITHRMNEVFLICDRVALLCDGSITMQGDIKDYTKEKLIEGLLPKKCAEDSTVKKCSEEYIPVDYSVNPVFELKSFSGYGFKDINLNVYPGEILGMAGVVGAGRTELATTVFGRDKVLGGQAVLAGEDITGLKTYQVIEKGLNYVSEDRFLNGIFRIANVNNNLISSCMKHLSKIFTNKKKEMAVTNKYIADFRIKVSDEEQLMGSLSGGNQQKVVIGRGLSTSPKLVILDEPTRGIDAGARSDVYSIIHGLKKLGVAVLLISSDMEELVQLSDRVVSMFRGQINREFKKEEINNDSLMAASFGMIE